MFLFILSLLVSANASTYTISQGKGEINFLAKGKPALISIKGTGTGATGSLSQTEDKISGDISFNLKTLKTGIDLRDEHLKEKYLEVEKYPDAKLTFVNLVVPTDTKEKFKFDGILELHGEKKPVVGMAQVITKDGLENIIAEFKIKLTDFNVGIPSFQGITVAEDVQVSVNLLAEKK